MWTARRAEALKRRAVGLCPPDVRCNVRFRGPETRRNFAKLTIENMDGADLRALVTAFPDCRFYIRTSGEASSAIDAYVPSSPRAARLATLTALAWAAALAAATAALAAVLGMV